MPEQSPIRVQISDSFVIDGIAVRISLHNSAIDTMVGKINENGALIFERYEIGTTSPGATFALNNDFARALLEALLRYYNGSEDARTTRADLLHERERVDKFISMYGLLATAIVERD
jgi:hypothetical protein